MSRTILLTASVSSIFCACITSEDNVALVEQMDGVMPNGVSLNGVMPNGVMPNNVVLDGVMPNGVMPNGTAVGLAGLTAPLTGADLVGSTWTGKLSDGSALPLRIDAAMQHTGTNADL